MCVSNILPRDQVNYNVVEKLKNLKARFLLTQFGSMTSSLISEIFAGHAAMSYSSLLMECTDFGISKAVSYGCDPILDRKSYLLKKIGIIFKKTLEQTTKAIRISAYVIHILAAGAGMYEAYRLLGSDFESPPKFSLLMTAITAGFNVWNYIDAEKVNDNVSGSEAMSLSGMKAMAQTNFAEMFGLITGVIASCAGWSKAGNFTVIGSSLGVIGLMIRQILREKQNSPNAYCMLKI